MDLPRVGTTAPDFTLPSTSGDHVTLSGLRGRKVLIAFFPLAFTRVCTAELCAFTEDYDRFAGQDTVILPISVDSVPTLREYRRKEGLSVDLLSDFRREVSRAYGTLLEDRFRSGRAYILVDREGIVRWAHGEESTGTRRENADLLQEIAAVP